MIAASRRSFLGGTACAGLLATTPALAFDLAAPPARPSGHVGLAADLAWWDPRGESERCRFPHLPISIPLTQERLDWMV